MKDQKSSPLFLKAAALLAALCISAVPSKAEEAPLVPEYHVILPASYEEEPDRSYPVIYYLAQELPAEEPDGIAAAMLETLNSQDAMDMILVCADLSGMEEENPWEMAAALVEEVDGSCRTVAQPQSRAVAGAGATGYLASMLTYTDGEGQLLKEPGLFAMAGSICPDYQSDTPYRESYGDFLEILNGGGFSNAIAAQFYTFIRTASEEETSFEAGGANDVIAAYIQKGAAYGGVFDAYYGNADNTVLDLTIVNGTDSLDFKEKAARDMTAGFSRRIVSSMVSGSVSLSPQAAKENAGEISAGYTLSLTPEYTRYSGGSGPASLSFSLLNPATAQPLAESVSVETTVQEGETSAENAAALPNIVEGDETQVTLTCSLLGADVLLDSAPLVRIREPGTRPEEQFIDLMGSWKFKVAGNVTPGELPAAQDYDTWEEVIPCLGWWDEGFSKETNMKAFSGYAWYVKTFDIPADFPEGTYHIPLGGFDETDMTWINGTRIGYTGLNGDTWQHEEDKWDTLRVYEADSKILNIGGQNEIIVLAHNASGDGGWYQGHPGLYTDAAYEARTTQEAGTGESRFVQVTIPSAQKAAAVGSEAQTEDESFLVYLPEGYDAPENAEKRYPTAYLFHQLNSSANSYVIDRIDRILDQGIAEGSIGEVIVVIPDSAPESWWMGSWADMVTEEILPYVDENFRTLADSAHRFTAGASMGGHGAYHIGLSHPELFSGIISYFGAINMGANPLGLALESDAEFLGGFKHYFVCGNRDLYKFGIPAIRLDQKLREEGIEHFFELGEGEHDSVFYLPYFADSFAYMTK